MNEWLDPPCPNFSMHLPAGGESCILTTTGLFLPRMRVGGTGTLEKTQRPTGCMSCHLGSRWVKAEAPLLPLAAFLVFTNLPGLT